MKNLIDNLIFGLAVVIGTAIVSYLLSLLMLVFAHYYKQFP